MAYIHDIAHCFTPKTDPGGRARATYDGALGHTAAALGRIRALHADGSLPLLRLPARRDDLPELRAVAQRFRADFTDIVVLGTGGSSLGGQTLNALADRGFGPPAGTPRLRFLDNIDPDTFAALLGALDLARTGVIAISKSGTTAETMLQLIAILDRFRLAGREAAIARHLLCITEPGDNALRRLAARFNAPILDHDPAIGGRYSALSLVGLLPALIAGLDAERVRAGAASVLDPVLASVAPGDVAPAIGAALTIAFSRARGVSASVLMPYVDRLAIFGLWYCQLWAESLGKDGLGTTPIRAIGAVDQHSQLQLYLGGPRDKLFTLVLAASAGEGPRVAADLATDPALAYLAGRTMGDLLAAEGRATVETLAANGCPTRVIRIERLDEFVIGALMMHFMLETIIAADLLQVNPFDQPAVEEGKVLARRYLAEMTRSSRA